MAASLFPSMLNPTSLFRILLSVLVLSFTLVQALEYIPEEADYNLNQNQTATQVLDYWGEWSDHDYHPSPTNWRFPFYTLFLDKFVNGDPRNDDTNGTVFESEVMGNLLRNGGDIKGLVSTLDYIQGMGINGIYIAGTPFINKAWGSDGYSPLDFSLLDRHFGNIAEWRQAMDEIHKRGMYVVLDTTVATMGDLVGFEGYLNETTPFSLSEHRAEWKTSRRYNDFSISNNYSDKCDYPRFWMESGERVYPAVRGCYDDDVDHYGDTEAFGVFPDWQRQLSKFASVQDRLREWKPDVMSRISHFACMTIVMLDIDGFRIDKATQITVDALGDWSDAVRQCAREVGKENFFIPGEITGGDTFGSIYIGRGREPSMRPKSIKESFALNGTNADDKYFIRDTGKNALDGGAFHYTVYRQLTRFLMMDGNLAAGYDAPGNWADMWNSMAVNNDLVNANTGDIDPRHMYGVTNQDVFRWPAIKNGVNKMVLGLFITTILMPGIPKLLWGEEQSFYVLDNTASNYIYGRQAMTSAQAWQNHGCYSLGSSQYYNFPLDKALHGCEDDWNSLDHRDPSASVHNIVKAMYHLRLSFPALNDGLQLEQLSNLTSEVLLPGSNGTATEVGIWSMSRAPFDGLQDFSQSGGRNDPVWLVFTNLEVPTQFEFDCADAEKGLYAPFEAGATVQNLFFPYEEYTIGTSNKTLFVNSVEKSRGCIESLDMPAWGFKALVRKEMFVANRPAITKFTPGHDARLVSTAAPGLPQTVDVGFVFTQEMDCDSLKKVITFSSRTEHSDAVVKMGNATCGMIKNPAKPSIVGEPQGVFEFKATLENVYDGIHTVSINNATASNNGTGVFYTKSNDHFLFRIGTVDNPMVFPRTANYTTNLLFKNGDDLVVTHKAAGADMFRYSTNWESSWSSWLPYTPGNVTIQPQAWNGTKKQRWNGEHIVMQYWSEPAGSSAHVQHSDLGSTTPRRFPHLFLQGPFNMYGYDAGIKSQMKQLADGKWSHNFMSEWPAKLQFNVWGVNPDEKPDSTFVYGDIDGDGVLERTPPDFLGENFVNVTNVPPAGYISYKMVVNDGTFSFEMIPSGSRGIQIMIYVLFFIIPVLTGGIAVYVYMVGFYGVKTNTFGIGTANVSTMAGVLAFFAKKKSPAGEDSGSIAAGVTRLPGERNRVLIATLEYDIEDWGIKIKIGGLGVMAQLMGKSLQHQDLIWVVPCVNGVDYPIDTPAESMTVTIMEKQYIIEVQYHVLNNITYVLLDAPVFRKQTRAEPYPPRMDDLESAVFYSAWNQCIAEVLRRFTIDLYHINDFHGSLAPIHILPETIPCVLSLHNAEFQGMWPMRTPKESDEVCKVFNISRENCQKYVQFGDVFNLLHAGASYLRIHQKGYGAVGVSAKYGKRSWARYPIFWGLSGVGKLPNPDPTDTAEYNPDEADNDLAVVDPTFEAGRGELMRQAQEWAGLEQNPDAELLVFVGRWSNQKGVDLIADVAPGLLKDNPRIQLICVGPVIDLFGKFASLKLSKMMELYPGRVYSKPEFTALPAFIFSGAEFALIPSRDEPFGLVAVEFGRKGALGIGARVGGLGNMPGWWFTVESTSPTHLLAQFESAIKEALSSTKKERAQMRATSARQRFPVQVWVKQLEKLQQGAKKFARPTTAMGSVDIQAIHDSIMLEAGPLPGTPDSINASIASFLVPPHYSLGMSMPNESTNTLSRLSMASVTSERSDFALTKFNATFTDEDGEYSRQFVRDLENIDPKSSKADLCIESYLIKSEKKWFNEVRMSKLGLGSTNSSTATLVHYHDGAQSPMVESGMSLQEISLDGSQYLSSPSEFPPMGIKLLLLRKIGDWPIYTFLLAIGQIIAANSYQITLLTDQISMTAERLYTISSIYIAGSIFWWFVFRRFKAVYVLSAPFLFYGAAFLLVGVSGLLGVGSSREWLGNVGTGLYSFASASGSLYFALNFGDEGGAPVKDWVFRACLIQGTQQSYVIALWYWGQQLTANNQAGTLRNGPNIVSSSIIIPVGILFWVIGGLLAYGLPVYYRGLPGGIPHFYAAVARRNIVKWFFVAVILQNYWLSAPYGRNWSYLWSSTHAPAWAIGMLIILFFGILWAASLFAFAKLTKQHSWLLPVFAIGLGAPRWCQMLWSTSNIGIYLPWAGGPVASALMGRSLWLWLGVLDAIQGLGLGMILLQTLTRMHVAFTLLGAQVLGSLATIAARATAPDNIGPGNVFPDWSGWRWGDSAAEAGLGWEFWLGLGCQVLVCAGYLLFFRKEQLTKP